MKLNEIASLCIFSNIVMPTKQNSCPEFESSAKLKNQNMIYSLNFVFLFVSPALLRGMTVCIG